MAFAQRGRADHEALEAYVESFSDSIRLWNNLKMEPLRGSRVSADRRHASDESGHEECEPGQ